MKSKAEDAVTGSVFGRRSEASATWRALERSQRLRIIGLAVSAGLLSVLFAQPLARVFRLVLQNELHSYIALVPVISGYLLYVRPNQNITFRSSVGAAILVAAFGIAALSAALGLSGLGATDNLSLMMLTYVSFIVATGFVCFGSEWMRAAAFPVAFLIFMVPLPDAVVNWLELALVAASADAAAWMFRVSNTPMLREGTILTLPNIVLEVARECSGIRSTVVLFITGVLASNLFLQSTARRIALVALVIPLAIARNGFRILVIGLLCVHIGPHMSESFIHRRGGPIFFALSLIPLLLFLFWLRRHDTRVDPRT